MKASSTEASESTGDGPEYKYYIYSLSTNSANYNTVGTSKSFTVQPGTSISLKATPYANYQSTAYSTATTVNPTANASYSSNAYRQSYPCAAPTITMTRSGSNVSVRFTNNTSYRLTCRYSSSAGAGSNIELAPGQQSSQVYYYSSSTVTISAYFIDDTTSSTQVSATATASK